MLTPIRGTAQTHPNARDVAALPGSVRPGDLSAFLAGGG